MCYSVFKSFLMYTSAKVTVHFCQTSKIGFPQIEIEITVILQWKICEAVNKLQSFFRKQFAVLCEVCMIILSEHIKKSKGS